jgi:hypothetical protein
VLIDVVFFRDHLHVLMNFLLGTEFFAPVFWKDVSESLMIPYISIAYLDSSQN